MFPGLLTEGITSATAYIFRGIAADSVRGLEFLLTRPELDPRHVVVVGNDLALITAALHPGATHLVTAPALFYDTVDMARQTTAYPLEEINDYRRAFPAQTEAVQRTLAYYDLRAFAPRVRATTLFMAGAPGSLLAGQALAPLTRALQGQVTVRDSEQSSYKDGLYVETWMAAQCGIQEVQHILPEHWR
jgi:cephalosporin-C deacetylase-like acetyl esterase